MKKLLLLLSAVASFSAFGQITITRADYGYIGDKVRFAIDTPAPATLNPLILTTGANKTWDFSTKVSANKYDSMRWTAPGTGIPAGTNIVVSNTTTIQYQNVDTNFVRLIIDQPAYNLTGLSMKIFKFPFTNGSVLIDSLNYYKAGTAADFNLSILTSLGFDSVKAFIKGWDTATCTGYGTINLPDTTTNVIQVKLTGVSDINLFGRNPITGWSSLNSLAASVGLVLHQKSIEYEWIGKNSKCYIARAQMDTNSGTVVQSFSYWVKKVILPPSLVSVSPVTVQKGQTQNIVISAFNTHFTKAKDSVQFTPQVSGTGTIAVNTVTVVDDTTLNCNITVGTNTVAGAKFNVMVYDSIDSYLYLNGAVSVVNTGVVNAGTASSNIKIFPNPADRMLTVSFAHQQTNSSVEIYDLTGRMLVNTSAKTGDQTIDISSLNNGIYFCKIYGDGFVKSEKFIISR